MIKYHRVDTFVLVKGCHSTNLSVGRSQILYSENSEFLLRAKSDNIQLKTKSTLKNQQTNKQTKIELSTEFFQPSNSYTAHKQTSDSFDTIKEVNKVNHSIEVSK